MAENLLVGSKTRAALKAYEVNVGGDALDALNEVVHWHIDQAAKRAAANRRKTVRGHDFYIAEDAVEQAPEPPAPAEVPTPAELPAPVASPEPQIEAAPFGGDPVQSAAADVAVGDAGAAVEEPAAEEAAAEEPPDAWSPR